MRRRRQGLNSPINNEIGMVIIPVTDLQTSVAWYGERPTYFGLFRVRRFGSR